MSTDNFEKESPLKLIKTESDFQVNKFLLPHGLKINNMEEEQMFL